MHSRASLAAIGINSVKSALLAPKRRVMLSARKDPKASAASSGTVIRASPHLAQDFISLAHYMLGFGYRSDWQYWPRSARLIALVTSRTFSNQGKTARTKPFARLDPLRTSSEPDRCG